MMEAVFALDDALLLLTEDANTPRRQSMVT
jgi:hypothetical protein